MENYCPHILSLSCCNPKYSERCLSMLLMCNNGIAILKIDTNLTLKKKGLWISLSRTVLIDLSDIWDTFPKSTLSVSNYFLNCCCLQIPGQLIQVVRVKTFLCSFREAGNHKCFHYFFNWSRMCSLLHWGAAVSNTFFIFVVSAIWWAGEAGGLGMMGKFRTDLSNTATCSVKSWMVLTRLRLLLRCKILLADDVCIYNLGNWSWL